jgi:hypothetical protein
LALGFAGCNTGSSGDVLNPNNDAGFVAVTGITGVPTAGVAGTTSVTAAEVAAGVFTPGSAGTLGVRATVAGGGDNGSDRTFTSIAAVTGYLASASGGATTAAPVDLTVTLTLADSANGWVALLGAIQTAGKYVALDLSACAMSENTEGVMEFDPGTANTGESKIVSLALPDVAESVKSGDYGNPIFKNFAALTRVTGANITEIGIYAFRNCAALTEADFPKAVTIGGFAFSGCAALTKVSFPAAVTIGDEWAFSGCEALTEVSFPAATTIGGYAFSGCATLTSVSFPVAASIGDGAFYECATLTEVSFPKAATIGGYAFYHCYTLTGVSFPVAASIGDNAFSGCDALTGVSFPAAATIGNYAFSGCDALTGVSFPAATTIGDRAFTHTSTTALTVLLGSTAPTLGYKVFDYVTAAKTVTVQVPSDAAGYGASPANTTTENWGNGFRGGGWDGSSFVSGGSVNSNITLTIEYISE